MEYSPHGQYELTIRGRIVFGRFTGAWNLEGVRNMLREYLSLTADLQDAPWAALHDHRNLQGSPLDAMAQLREGLIKGVRQKMTHAALVVDDLDLARGLLGEVYQGTGAVYEFFSEPDAALAWLKELGYSDEAPLAG